MSGSNLSSPAFLPELATRIQALRCPYPTLDPPSGTAQVFPRERTIVNRERTKHSYGIAPYLGAKLLAELPIGKLALRKLALGPSCVCMLCRRAAWLLHGDRAD